MIPPSGPRAPALRRPIRRSAGPFLATAFVFCLACAPRNDVREQIEAVTRRWERSLVAGEPAAAVAEVFTEDAVRLPAGEAPVSGRADIAAALAGSAALAEARFHIEELEADGGLAWARGTYAVRAPDGQGFAGKFLEVWKRTADGWRLHRVMWD